ncbi:STAS domain-containing protein [Streptomyces sp. NPDC090046]|uniref:STAS domain-containing protein n=1 Tax=Streptomyces sp. NPDC090046 TaxID=3365928 RepID=UPI003815EF49
MCFHITLRQYGPTVHLTPRGELDLDGEQAFERSAALLASTTAVIACDMQHVTFMDATGLQRFLDFARTMEARGIGLFVYNWRRQPMHLLGLFDDLNSPQGPAAAGGSATEALRRTLTDRVSAGREAGMTASSSPRSTNGVRVAAGLSARPGRFRETCHRKAGAGAAVPDALDRQAESLQTLGAN